MQPQRTLLFLHKPQICSHLASACSHNIFSQFICRSKTGADASGSKRLELIVKNDALNRGGKRARREEPAAATVAASVAAGVHESGSVSASWPHASVHAGSVGASWWRASTHAGRLVGCMHSRLLSWRRAQAFNARDGPAKSRPNSRTPTPPNVAPLVRVNGQSTDPTATSVVTSSEGFGQGSGEN